MDVIAAISTAPGIGSIGIVRMSGKDTFKILEKVFVQKNAKNIDEIKGYSIKYGNIIDSTNGEIIDEVLVSYFKEPKSYTTENMCEINSHGGQVVIKRILKECLKNGANLAEPGEFTKRAFLNGRIDLSQAESIIDLINSKSEKEAKAGINGLEGFLSTEIKVIREKILDVMSDIEASIDYPEYDIEELTDEKIINTINFVEERLKNLSESFENGKIIKEGIKTAIIGRPNAGKSSLLNAILKEERAIVTDIEGTTRDSIEEFITIEGIPVKLIDTAGIRDSEDKIEKIGIEKSKEIANQADLVIAIFDCTKELNKKDIEILDLIKNKNAIIILNKIDIGINILKENQKINNSKKPVIEISALEKSGINKLYLEISKMFSLNKIDLDNSVLITNIRHKNKIDEAIKNVCNTKKAVEEKMPLDIISIYIKSILESLGEITGENVSEEIINEIFSKFCLGK